MKKITISISGKDYDISLDDDFAKYFEVELHKLNNGVCDVKTILNAFIEKSYENFLITKKTTEIMEKI